MFVFIFHFCNESISSCFFEFHVVHVVLAPFYHFLNSVIKINNIILNISDIYLSTHNTVEMKTFLKLF